LVLAGEESSRRGKGEIDRGSCPGFTADRDLPAMTLDDAFYRRQADPAPRELGLGVVP